MDNFLETLWPIIILILFGALFLTFIKIKKKKFKVFNWIFQLIAFYLIFGIIQQIFFQAVFTHTLFELFGNPALVVIFSGIFYSLFHTALNKKGLAFGSLTLFLIWMRWL